MGSKHEIGIGSSGKFGVVLEKTGLFNYHEFYDVFSDWFDSNKYTWDETEYSTKTKPQGKDVINEYKAFRKVTDYLKFYIDIRVEIRFAKTLKIEAHKKQQGFVTVRFKAYYERDYKNKWKVKFFRKIYEMYFIKELILRYEGKLWAEANDLINKTKETLGLMTK